jgi:hypothetical protein
MVAISSLSMSDSVFLQFSETDLLRREYLDFTDCREEEEIVEMGNSMGREAVESPGEAKSCAPCPGSREGMSERPDTWRARERGKRVSSGALKVGWGGRGGGGCRRGCPSGWRLPVSGVDDFPSGDNSPSGRVAAGH